MTPADLRFWREQHGLSPLQLAAALGVHPITIARWEREESGTTIPPFLWLALKELARHKRRA